MKIEPVPAAAADDAALVDEICGVVNRAYDVTERHLWTVEFPRTDAAEMKQMIAAGWVLVARRDGRVVGSVWTRLLDATTGWFAALGVDPQRGEGGIGGALVDACERRAAEAGATAMRLELLIARPTYPHAERLARWYARRGYREVARVDLATYDAAAHAVLAVDGCEVATLEKPL